MARPHTLFARTALAMAIALLAFVLLTGFLVFHYILSPLGHRAADDLAALMVLSAQTWVELPPETRADFVAELKQNHRLLLLERPPAPPTTPLHYTAPYLRFLVDSLRRRLGQETRFYQVADMPGWFWTTIPVAGRELHLGFSHDRIGALPPRVLLGILLGAGLFVLFTTLFLVRLINQPLARLDRAVRQLGHRGFSDPLPEQGPRELAVLARKFNELGREIQRLLENRTTLLGGISHDLRTPITTIQLLVETLRLTDTGKRAKREKLLDSIADQTLTLQQLAQELMDLSMIESGRLPLRLEPTSLEAFIEPAISRLEAQIERKALQLERSYRSDWQVLADVETMQRVMQNLLHNAIKFTPEGGRIRIGARDAGEDVLLFIQDSGPGIPAEHLDRIFERFYKTDPARSGGGSGLGLAIAKHIVEGHGGRIWAESAPGEGATISFTLLRA
jgi:two-component system osmolarity sensor histidine kinase EnvZ